MNREKTFFRHVLMALSVFMPMTVIFLGLYKVTDNILFYYLAIVCLTVLGVAAILTFAYIAVIVLFLLLWDD